MKKLLLSIILLFSVLAGPANAFWIWTPKSGKWVNPKTMPKPTPKEQFEYAASLYEIKNYEEAKREFDKLLKAYPRSLEASESQYYLGLIAENQDNLYQAFLDYQKVIDKYPFSERIQEIIEREYKIGEAFMSGYRRTALGVPLPVENPAIEIFSKVVENSTFGPLAPQAQYKLGLVLKGLARYYEAEEAFNKVISNYPNSEWAEASKYQIAVCRAATSRGPSYDQGAAKEAEQKFEEFIQEHPDASLSQQAEKSLDELREKEAEANYNIARFYEKQKAYTAARIYYSDIMKKYPTSKWSYKALERARIIDKLEKEK
ncbi:MAG: outer membrane protein assembly factor BamD [Candidatus Omnitrophica bacterium]|nr:outer membrane protein assembly factor BamD [Candidatus Omnitrophota bacterium]